MSVDKRHRRDRLGAGHAVSRAWGRRSPDVQGGRRDWLASIVVSVERRGPVVLDEGVADDDPGDDGQDDGQAEREQAEAPR